MAGSPTFQFGFSIALLSYFSYFMWDGFCRTPPRFSKENLATLCCLFYLLSTIGLIAVGRASLYEGDLWGASLDGRYRIYSILFSAICCIDAVERLGKQEAAAAKFSAVLVTFVLLFNLVWFVPSAFKMRFDSERRENAMEYWQETHDISALPLWSTPPEDARNSLDIAIRNGVYRP